jgi:peroxiredoxin
MVERLAVPFPVLSDAQLQLASALRLPTFTVAGQTLNKRLAWIQRDGVIRRVFYPGFRQTGTRARSSRRWQRCGVRNR